MTAHTKYVMKGELPIPPYTNVSWAVWDAADFTGASSGYSNLINIVVDYTVVDNVTSGGNTGNSPAPPIPSPPIPDIAKVGYVMKGLTATAPYNMVTWKVWNLPDFTGAQSGYPVGSLTDIVVDYTVVDEVNRGAQALPVNYTGFTAGGDLSGTIDNQTVIGLQGHPISSAQPPDGYVLTWSDFTNSWSAQLVGTGSSILVGDVIGTAGSNHVVKLRGNSLDVSLDTVGVTEDGYVLTWINGSSAWKAKPTPTQFVAGGDLTGTETNQTVAKIQNIPVKPGTPTDGYVLTYVSGSSDWEAKPTTPTFVGGGDLTGNSTLQTVIGIRGKTLSPSLASVGTTQDGYVLTYVNGSNDWEAKPTANAFVGAGDLTGNYANQTVIGIRGKTLNSSLATIGVSQDGYILTWVNGSSDWEAKPAPVQFVAAGDLSGTATNQNVINIHGASVPIAGALVTGNILRVSGTSSLTYSALNLAGGANYVTGVLPTANQANQTMAGDITGTTAASIVGQRKNFLLGGM